MLANLRQSVSDWIFRATVPETPPVTLVQRRIFILPTRQGYVFAFTVLILLFWSIWLPVEKAIKMSPLPFDPMPPTQAAKRR